MLSSYLIDLYLRQSNRTIEDFLKNFCCCCQLGLRFYTHSLDQDHNQIKSYYTRCITLKRVTSWRGPSPRQCARVTQLLSKKCCSGGEPLGILMRLDRLEIRTLDLPLQRQTRYRSTNRLHYYISYKLFVDDASFVVPRGAIRLEYILGPHKSQLKRVLLWLSSFLVYNIAVSSYLLFNFFFNLNLLYKKCYWLFFSFSLLFSRLKFPSWHCMLRLYLNTKDANFGCEKWNAVTE